MPQDLFGTQAQESRRVVVEDDGSRRFLRHDGSRQKANGKPYLDQGYLLRCSRADMRSAAVPESRRPGRPDLLRAAEHDSIVRFFDEEDA